MSNDLWAMTYEKWGGKFHSLQLLQEENHYGKICNEDLFSVKFYALILRQFFSKDEMSIDTVYWVLCKLLQ